MNKKVLAVASIYLLYQLFKKKQPKIGYIQPQEMIIHNMINSIGSISLEFPEDNMSAADRKKLLADSLKYEKSNIKLAFEYDKPKSELQEIKNSRSAFNILKEIYPKDKVDANEVIAVLYLNRANKVIAHDIIHVGAVNASLVDARLIIQKAILLLASGIIVSHNHPSGNNRPSQPDITLTKKLKNSFSLIDISLHDHIIVSDIHNGVYFSFADEGMI